MGQTLEYLLKLQDQFSGPMKNARDEQGRFTAGTKKMGESAGAVNSLSGAFVGLAAKIGAAFTVYKALEAGFAGFKHALSVASQMETTQTSFKTMLGSASAMMETLGEIKKLAMSTPFEFPELANAGRMLLAFGETAKDIPGTLRRIGDVSAAISAPIGEIAEIYGKARTQGTLFAEDINQLTGRGIPIIRELAKVLGKPESAIKKLAEEGRITFPLLDQAFRNLTGSGGQFFGMMAEQAKTSAGLWSSLKDGVNELFLALGTPLNDAIKPLLTDAMGLADQLKPMVAQIGTHMGSALTAVRDFVAEATAGSGLAGAMGAKLTEAFAKAADVVGAPFRAMADALPALGKGLMAVFRPVGEWLMAKLNAAAEMFASKMMSGMASVMESLPMQMGSAAAEKLKGEALNQSVTGMRHSAEADDAKDRLPGAAKEAVGLLGAAMAAFRDKAKEEMARLGGPVSDLPPSALDQPYNPMFPGGVLPNGAKEGGKAPEWAKLPDSPLSGETKGPPKSILEGLAGKPTAAKAVDPFAGGEAPGAKDAVAAANAAKAPAITPAGKARESAGAAAANTRPPMSASGGGFAPMTNGGSAGAENDGPNKIRGVQASRLMGGADGGALSRRGPGSIPARMMGGGGAPPPNVPSPGTARRSQERREAAATSSRESGGGHPLMAIVKEIQTKLNTLAVAR